MTQEDIDASDQLEQAVISAFCWARPAERDVAAHTIHPRHFRHGRNRTLWEHAKAIHQGGDQPDAVTLLDSLVDRGHLDAAGGPVHLHDVVAASPVGATVTSLADRLIRGACRREAIAAAGDLQAQLHDTPADMLIDTAARGAADIVRAASAGRAAGHLATSDLVDQLEDLWTNGADHGWESGWTALDRLYRPARGQLTVVTGIPAAGKTTWLNAYLARLAHRHGHRYALFSPEQSSPVKHIRNLTVVHGGPLMSADVRRQAQRWVLDRFEWVNHRETGTLPEVLAAVQSIHHRRRVDGFVVDPWNWIEASRPPYMSETEFVGYALNDIVRAAQDLDVHAWVVAHPRKVDKHADGSYAVAGPYDIAGSANWFNKPWFVLSLWRDHLADGSNPDRDPTVLDVHVMKVRDDDQGRVGKASMRMQPDSRRYGPLAHVGGQL